MSDDEAARKAEKPTLSADEVPALAKRLFGVTVATTVEIDSYDDRNFRVDCDSGECFIFKVHNGVESLNLSFVEAQIGALAHLAAADVLCSVGVPAQEGECHASCSSIAFVELPLKLGGGLRRHAVRLLRWVPGRLLSEVEQTPAVLHATGRFIARVDERLRGFEHAATERTFVWDLRSFELVEPFLSSVAEEGGRRAMVESVLRDYRALVLPLAAALPRSVLQNDPNDHNILYDAAGEAGRFAMLDFGDLVRTWSVSDLAIGMAYIVIGCVGKDPDPLQRAVALYAGYTSASPLSEEERGVLVVLVAGRLATSVTMGAYSLSKDPGNEYLKLHAEPGWGALELVLAADPAAFMGRCEAARAALCVAEAEAR